MRAIASVFIGADIGCDFLPGVSTATNSFNLLLKAAMKIPVVNRNLQNRYFQHVKQKKIARTVVLLVPIIGNFIVAMADFFTITDVAKAKKAIQSNPANILRVAKDLEEYEELKEMAFKLKPALQKHFS